MYFWTMIIVTGAAGFIAPHIIYECLEKKYKVFGIDIVDEDKYQEYRDNYLKFPGTSEKYLWSIFLDNIK